MRGTASGAKDEAENRTDSCLLELLVTEAVRVDKLSKGRARIVRLRYACEEEDERKTKKEPVEQQAEGRGATGLGTRW